MLIDLVRVWARIFIAKYTQNWTHEVGCIVNRTDRVFVCQILWLHDDTTTPTINNSIEPLHTTACQICLSSTGASSKNTDFPIDIRQRPQIFQRPLKVAKNLIISDTTLSPHFGSDIFGCAVTSAEIKIRRQSRITIVGEFASSLSIPHIPTGHMVNHHHCW